MSGPTSCSAGSCIILVRLAENATGETWLTLRTEPQKCHLGRIAGRAGEVAQRTELSARQCAIFAALRVPEPPPLRPPQDAGQRPHTARWLTIPPTCTERGMGTRSRISCGIAGRIVEPSTDRL